MADEDVVIRRRLLTRTSTLGKTGLKKCAEGVLTLLDAFADESVEADVCKQDMDALFWDLEQLEFEASKTDILSFTSQRELEAYEKLNADIDASISTVAKDIDALKTKVLVEKTIRAYKEEYESIARVINELPTRKAIALEIATEEKRSRDAIDAAAAVDSKLALRTKQFALLMATIQDLSATLDEDNALDEQTRQQHADGEANDADDMDDDGDDNDTPAQSPPPTTQRDDDMNDDDDAEAIES